MTSPAVSRWVSSSYSLRYCDQACALYCASRVQANAALYCASRVQANAAFRSALFGSLSD